MSIENSLFDFITDEVAAAPIGTVLFDSIVHADTYEEILKGEKWIRIDDVMRSQPKPVLGLTREFNAFIEIQCVARPEAQTNIGRRAARGLATNMALELFNRIEATEQGNLRDTSGVICGSIVTAKRNEWRKVGNVRHAVSFLLLQVNPREF